MLTYLSEVVFWVVIFSVIFLVGCLSLNGIALSWYLPTSLSHQHSLTKKEKPIPIPTISSHLVQFNTPQNPLFPHPTLSHSTHPTSHKPRKTHALPSSHPPAIHTTKSTIHNPSSGPTPPSFSPHSSTSTFHPPTPQPSSDS